MGEPETQKISDYSEELKNWDPTDEKQENPWIIYKKKVKEQEELRKKRYDAAIQATINVSKFNREIKERRKNTENLYSRTS